MGKKIPFSTLEKLREKISGAPMEFPISIENSFIGNGKLQSP